MDVDKFLDNDISFRKLGCFQVVENLRKNQVNKFDIKEFAKITDLSVNLGITFEIDADQFWESNFFFRKMRRF